MNAGDRKTAGNQQYGKGLMRAMLLKFKMNLFEIIAHSKAHSSKALHLVQHETHETLLTNATFGGLL